MSGPSSCVRVTFTSSGFVSGDTRFMAAHGDREVVAILADGTVKKLASNMPAVALSADPAMNLLVVVTNDHE